MKNTKNVVTVRIRKEVADMVVAYARRNNRKITSVYTRILDLVLTAIAADRETLIRLLRDYITLMMNQYGYEGGVKAEEMMMIKKEKEEENKKGKETAAMKVSSSYINIPVQTAKRIRMLADITGVKISVLYEAMLLYGLREVSAVYC